IKQPPEGLHFGLTAEGDGSYQKSLGRQLYDGAVKPGKGFPLDPPIAAPMSGRGPRVLAVTELATTLAKRLADIHGRSGGPVLTSAEFAVQMVDVPGVAVFGVTPDQRAG